MSNVNYKPDGFHTLTPSFAVKDAARAVEFYKQAFGAKELGIMRDPGGVVHHAELMIGDSPIMLGQHGDADVHDPKRLPLVSSYVYVEDADRVHRQALAAGAKEIYPMKDQFYGNREGGVEDPFGIVWWIATRKEEVSGEELQKRASLAHGGHA
ncbi:MAG: VOC family protein [Bryobacteraceae bacterium]